MAHAKFLVPFLGNDGHPASDNRDRPSLVFTLTEQNLAEHTTWRSAPEFTGRCSSYFYTEPRNFHLYLIRCAQYDPFQIPSQSPSKVEHIESCRTVPLLVIFARFFSCEYHQWKWVLMEVSRDAAASAQPRWELLPHQSSSSSCAPGFPHSCHPKNVSMRPFPLPYFVFLHELSSNHTFYP